MKIAVPKNIELYFRTLFTFLPPLFWTNRSKIKQKNSSLDWRQSHFHDSLHLLAGGTRVPQDAEPVDRVGEALPDRGAVEPGRDLASLLPLLHGGGQYVFHRSKRSLHLSGNVGVTQSEFQRRVCHQTAGGAVLRP